MRRSFQLIEPRRLSLVKPTIDTRFHIDFNWWENNDRNWRVYLRSYLCAEHQNLFVESQNSEMVDWVDPQTAEVQPVDGLQHTLISHCARQPGFITEHTAVVDAIFRLFLANGNLPLSCVELGERLGKPPMTILRTLTGGRVYKGVRPILD
jgi:hypothetical protein